MLYFKNFVFNAEKSLPLLLTFTFYLLFRATVKKTSGEFPDILPTAIESININCEPVLSGSRSIVKYKYWTFNYDTIEKELYESENVCDTIHKYFFFEKEPLSLEEQAYPLSYGLVIYKDIVQYLSGTDLPLRTNLEMVRIMKALNGSINTDVEQFEQDRYRIMEVIFRVNFALRRLIYGGIEI
ncbi:hypothetical protein Y032_0028g1719 [Ancylostoma ceylanicum]|nr:hypothetical protein Y032_0028g1719 [Ancylostoma ceylanicum]